MQLLEITIDNTSPLIFYSPFSDTLSTPNLSNGWNLYYDSSGFASSPGQVGTGNSSHITSKNGAYLSLQWNGNGIQLIGNATLSSYAITLDGADVSSNATSLPNRTLVDIWDLPEGDHTITLTARTPQNQIPLNSSMLVFDEAVVRTSPQGATANCTFQPQTLDRNSVSYNGRWSFEPMASGPTVHTSTTTGDRASATFNGTAFILQGMTTLEAGNYSVTLDGITTMLSAQSSFTVLNTTLFLATGLNDSVVHSVEVTNNGGTLTLLEDGFGTFVATPGSDTPTTKALPSPSATRLAGGTIASFALAGILFAIISAAGLFYCFILKKRRGSLQSTKWDDQRYMVSNASPGSAASLRSSWALGRRTQTSYDIASYGVKGDTMTLESGTRLEGSKASRRGKNGFRIWRREVVEGTTHDISLPILFKHPDSDFAMSSEVESPDSKHPYLSYNPVCPWEKFVETKKNPSSTGDDAELKSVALANLKNKGKARQLTGAASTMEEHPADSGSRRSLSPNLLRGLHVRMSSRKTWSTIKTRQGSLNLSLNPSTSPPPRRYRNSDLDRLSSFEAASNPSPLPRDNPQSTTSQKSTETPSVFSVPRSVSDSISNTITPGNQRNSRRYLLDDHTAFDESFEQHEGEPLPQSPHAYRNQGSDGPVIPNSFSFGQVVHSLSPRISEIPADDTRYSNLDMHPFDAEGRSEEQPTLEEAQLMNVEASSSPSGGDDSSSSLQIFSNVVDAPSETHSVKDDIVSPSTQPESDTMRLRPILPSLKRTSPFDIKFDWQSDRESMILNPKSVSDRSSKRFVVKRDSRDDFVQGASRSRFRLTPSTMSHPPNLPSYAPSQASDVNTSFLDFTNSEGSSVRTHSFKSRIFGGSSTQLTPTGSQARGRIAELKSRWSDTTSSKRDSSQGNGSSSSGDKSSRKPYHTSTIPSIHVTSESEIRRQRESGSSTQFSTEIPLHIHPPISDVESRTDSLPSHRHFDTLVRTGGSDESSGTSSRRTTGSSNPFHNRPLLAPLPEGTDEASTSSVYVDNPS